jgi:hypothetical protein
MPNNPPPAFKTPSPLPNYASPLPPSSSLLFIFFIPHISFYALLARKCTLFPENSTLLLNLPSPDSIFPSLVSIFSSLPFKYRSLLSNYSQMFSNHHPLLLNHHPLSCQTTPFPGIDFPFLFIYPFHKKRGTT